MKRSRKKWLGLILASSAFFIFNAGYGISDEELSISPESVTLEVNQTQQFTASGVVILPNVQGGGCSNKSGSSSGSGTWTVVGGDDNGTISSTGLYTAPSVLPFDPEVTVEFSDSLSTAQAIVNLRTGNDITFGDLIAVNETPIVINAIFAEGLTGGNAKNRVASLLSNGTLRTNFIWLNEDSSDFGDVFFNQQINLGALTGEENITNVPSSTQVPQSLVIADDQNLGLFITGTAGLQFMTSSNAGQSFGTPSTIEPAVNTPGTATSALDDTGTLHVAYTNNLDFVAPLAQSGEVKYGQSTDGGATWTTQEIDPSGNIQMNPAMAMSANGETIYLCYGDDLGTPTSFAMMFTKSTNGGSTWSTPIQVKSGTTLPAEGVSLFCQLDIGPNNEIYIGFIESPSGSLSDIQVWLMQSSDGGDTFGNLVQVSSEALHQVPYYFNLFFMDVDSQGRINMAWGLSMNDTEDTPDAVMFARSVDGGQNFSSEILVGGGNDQFEALPFGLTHDIADRVYIFFGDAGNADDYDAFFRIGQ